MSDYCSVTEVKTELGIAPGDTTDDSRLKLAISGVSRAIESYCGKRRFYALTETRFYTAKRTDRILIDDCLAVTTLLTDMAGKRLYEFTWPSDQFDLLPENAALNGYPYSIIQVAPLGIYRFPSGLALGVQVQGSFGYSTTTPEDVHQAALYQVCLQFRGKDAPLGIIAGGTVRQEMTASALHPFTKRLLYPYRRLMG